MTDNKPQPPIQYLNSVLHSILGAIKDSFAVDSEDPSQQAIACDIHSKLGTIQEQLIDLDSEVVKLVDEVQEMAAKSPPIQPQPTENKG